MLYDALFHLQHEIQVTATVIGGPPDDGDLSAQTVVQIVVADVNDNVPKFLRPNPQVTLIEEDDRDLPRTVAEVSVEEDVGRPCFLYAHVYLC